MSSLKLPEGWTRTTLGAFMDFKNGINAAKEAYGKGIKFVNVMDIVRNNYLSSDDVVGSVEITDKQLEEFSVVRGDILFHRTHGTPAETAFSSVYLGEEKITFGGFVIRGRQTKQLLLPEFSKYCFKNETIRKEMTRRRQGVIRANIGQKDLSKVPIVIPPVDEQKEIVSILDMWEHAIEKTEALIEAKERQFMWLTVKLIGEQTSHLSRLGDHFGSSITVEKGKTITKAHIAENGDIPVIAGGKTSPYNHDQLTHSIPCITISTSGAHAGYVWYHDYPIWASDCNVIYSTDHSTEYLYFALKSKQSRIYAFQSGGGQPHVYVRDLKNIVIPLPTLGEQKRIAEILNTAQREINLLKELTHQYRKQKRGLMQKLLSGTWHIRHINNKEDT